MTALSINLHAEEQRAKIEALQRELAKRLLSLRQNVVIEWGAWGKAERDAFRTAARVLGARVELYYLSVPLEELFARIQQRNMEDPPIEWAEIQKWADIFEAPGPAELTLFDAHPGFSEVLQVCRSISAFFCKPGVVPGVNPVFHLPAKYAQRDTIQRGSTTFALTGF